MKSKSTIFFIILIYLTYGRLNSQVYTPLSFLNYHPKWSRMHNTDKVPVIADSWVFLEANFGQADLTIHDGIMYNVYNILFGKAWMGGYYLEAVDLNTGTLIWDHIYYSERIGERRYGQSPVVQRDTIKFVLFEEFDNTDTLFKPIWRTAFPRQINFDRLSGDVLNSSLNAAKDPQALKLGPPIPLTVSQLYPDGDNFIYIINLPLTNVVTNQSLINLQRYILNQKGKVIDSIVVNIPVNFQKTDHIIKDVEDNSLFCFYGSRNMNNPVNEVVVGFAYLTRSLEVIDSGRIENLLPEYGNQAVNYYASKDFFVVGFDTVDNQDRRIDTRFLGLFNRKASMLENINLKDLDVNISIQGKVVRTTVVSTPEGPRILFCINTIPKNTLDFYISDGKGGYRSITSIKIDPQTKSQIQLVRMQPAGNDILCYFLYRENATGFSEPPLWSSWVMINGKDLGLSGTKDLGKSENFQLELSPNPVADILNVKFDRFVSGKLLFYDQSGTLVKKETVKDRQEFDISIQNLSSGIYNVHFQSRKMNGSGSFVKL